MNIVDGRRVSFISETISRTRRDEKEFNPMKKLILAVTAILFFIGSSLYADVAMNISHKNLKWSDGSSVNCAFCHEKAAIPKPKGSKNYDKYLDSQYCKGQGCHPLPGKTR
jgi:hypothetical protein